MAPAWGPERRASQRAIADNVKFTARYVSSTTAKIENE